MANASSGQLDGMSSRDLTPRVRMRTTFDPEQELPRLQRWFSENQHPTRFQVRIRLLDANLTLIKTISLAAELPSSIHQLTNSFLIKPAANPHRFQSTIRSN